MESVHMRERGKATRKKQLLVVTCRLPVGINDESIVVIGIATA